MAEPNGNSAAVGCLGMLVFVGVIWALVAVVSAVGNGVDTVLHPTEHAAKIAKAKAEEAREEAAAAVAAEEEAKPTPAPPAPKPVKFTPPDLDPEAPVNPATVSSNGYANIDRLTSWTALVGRGVGCQFDTGGIYGRIQKWMIKVSNIDDPENGVAIGTLTSLAELSMEQNAKTQLYGGSPDTCDEVARSLREQVWP